MYLHKVPCKLAVAFPELVEGKVHAAVVDQIPGDGQRISLGNAILQHALTENYHDALPVAARHLSDARGQVETSRDTGQENKHVSSGFFGTSMCESI